MIRSLIIRKLNNFCKVKIFLDSIILNQPNLQKNIARLNNIYLHGCRRRGESNSPSNDDVCNVNQGVCNANQGVCDTPLQWRY